MSTVLPTAISAPAASGAVERVIWIDSMKAIGIVLVVLGHTTGLPEVLGNQIYAFHMPLFFWISGFLLSDAKLKMPLLPYIRVTAKSLLVPYLLFATGSLAYWAVSHRYGSLANTTFYEAVSGIWIGHGPALFINTPLWFFTALFLLVVCYRVLSGWFSERSLLFILAVLAVPGVLYTRPEMRLPWNADLVAVVAIFYAVGRWSAPRMNARLFSMLPLWGWSIITLGWLLSVQFNGEVNLNRSLFGNWWLLFYVNAFVGIYLLAWLCHALPLTTLTRWLAHNSLIIFPSHVVFFGLFTAIGVLVFGLRSTFKDAGIYCVPYTVAAIACAVPLAYCLPRLMPGIFRPFPSGRR